MHWTTCEHLFWRWEAANICYPKLHISAVAGTGPYLAYLLRLIHMDGTYDQLRALDRPVLYTQLT